MATGQSACHARLQNRSNKRSIFQLLFWRVTAAVLSARMRAMANNEQTDLRTAALLIIASVALIAILYIGGQFLVPIVLALVFNVLFRPVVRWMEKLRLSSTIAAGIIVLGIIAL